MIMGFLSLISLLISCLILQDISSIIVVVVGQSNTQGTILLSSLPKRAMYTALEWSYLSSSQANGLYCHIRHWMQQRLANGNVADFVDTRMQEEYDVNSIWKAADIAMKCTAATSARRPQLKEALALEASQDRSPEMSVQASESSESEVSEVARG